MYYSQNTQNIRTVILSFDGVMTGLAKLRYNYYRRFCKLYDQKLDNETYFNQCHSFSTMYHHCPIASTLITEENLSKKVEEDFVYIVNPHDTSKDLKIDRNTFEKFCGGVTILNF